VSTTKATTVKFEEIKEKKRKLRARSYNSFVVVGADVIQVIFLFSNKERKEKERTEFSENVAVWLMTAFIQGHRLKYIVIDG